MNNNRVLIAICALFLVLVISACAPAPEITAQYDPGEIKFSGDSAYTIEEEFVTSHLNRVAGQPARPERVARRVG